jgi:UDP-N-acetylmuramyl pentapeptide phosphotransferase/UDP-N-acetylglucosamine-1-phosphate transferase
MPAPFGINLTTSSALFSFCIIVLTFVLGFVYRRAWRRLRGPEVTPSGFGVLLAFVLLGSATVASVSFELVASMIVIAVAAVGYWFDDIIELRAQLRILISFAVGAAIVSAFVNWSGANSVLLIFGICLAAGFVNVVFTNIVNFYDGVDLNLATFIVLTVCLVLVFLPAHSEWWSIAVACLAFIIPFAVMNSRPKTIYLGDSGSFVFASLLTVMAVSFFKDLRSIPAEAAIPVALPAFDVFFVLLKRIREKHDLLTRNYLHLYQRLNRRYAGFGYLLPQIMNALLCLVVATAFQAAGFGKGFSVILAMTTVTIPFYFACRWFFLTRRPDVNPAPDI